MLGKIGDKRRREQQSIKSSDRITDSMDMNLSKFWKIVKDRGGCCASGHRVAKSQTQLRD